MGRSNKRRRRLSAGLVLAMLLTQFATVAFACRTDSPAPIAMPKMAAMLSCQEMAAGADNPQNSSANPILCHAHCDQGAQATPTPVGIDPPATAGFFAGTPTSAALLLLVPVSVQSRNTALADSGPAPGWPPAWLAYLVLRN